MMRSPPIRPQWTEDLSSPDPLATSFIDEHANGSNTNGSHNPPLRRHSNHTSANLVKHTKSSSHSIEIFPSSPFRAVTEQNLSPWKIRVTVEAEPEDGEMDATAPTTKSKTRSTKIPVYEDSSPTTNVRSSARGRKSQPASGNGKRGETPVRGRRKSSRSRRQSVTDLDIIPLGDDSEGDDWLKQQKSPRKRRSTRKSTGAVGAATARSSVQSNTRSKRTSGTFDVRPDTDAEIEDEAGEPGPALPNESPELKKLDLNQISSRPRALSTKKKDNSDCGAEEINFNDKLRVTTRRDQLEIRKVSVNSAKSYPTPSPTSSYHGDSDDIQKQLVEDDASQELEDGGFDTIQESEGFTMIDLDTLPSAKQYLSSPTEGALVNRSRPESADKLEGQKSLTSPQPLRKGATTSSLSSSQQDLSYPVLRVDESEISSTVPSSPPALEQNVGLLKVSSSAVRPGLLRKVTPQLYSSPKLPSPPRHPVRRTPQHQHRGSSGALFAGIALQEVMSPVPPGGAGLPKERKSSLKMSSSLVDEALFKGYGSGTQRELRAGLRFGEELAKRQTSEGSVPSPEVVDRQLTHSGPDRLSHDANKDSIIVLDHVRTIHPSRPSFDESDRAPDDYHDTTMEEGPKTPRTNGSEPQARFILDTQARREREWQLEREAIIRQIQNASESQVIVIDSDSDEEELLPETQSHELQADDDDETDIWLAEAKSSSSPHTAPQGDNNELFTRTEQRRQHERAQEVINRPKRSLIPSPWKRGENTEAPVEQSTFLSTNLDELSGLMAYHEPIISSRFGASQIQRAQFRQKRNSGKFDIDLMAGTPRKVADDEGTIDSSNISGTVDDEEPEQSLEESGNQEPSGATEDNGNFDDVARNAPSDFSEADLTPTQPVKIPVNFNDSSMSMSTTPPKFPTSQTTLQDPISESQCSDSPPHPPTPRSAMKGSRGTFRQGDSIAVRPDTPTMIRQVIFSGRSRGVDIDGQESSFSMRSSSDDASFGDVAGMQLWREMSSAETRPVKVNWERDEIRSAAEERHLVAAPGKEEPVASAGRTWSNWIWGSGQEQSKDSRGQGQVEANGRREPPPSIMASQHPQTTQKSQSTDEDWQKTKSSIASASSHSPTSNNPSPVLPSYLLPPSYPSDPDRSITTPLSLRGEFTNTHFRTLHIIYRKSLRPKFHPPPRNQIRDSVWDLRGKEVIIDETESGLIKGEFVWTVGDGEVEVLERFMQEVELSNGWFDGRKIDGRGKGDMRWGWTVEELAGWLCRIVVGEVVREEERMVREKQREPVGEAVRVMKAKDR